MRGGFEKSSSQSSVAIASSFLASFTDILQHFCFAVSAVYSGTLSFWFFPLARHCYQKVSWVDEIFRQHFSNFLCIHVTDNPVPRPVDILFNIYSIPQWVSIRSPTASWEAVVSFNYTFASSHCFSPLGLTSATRGLVDLDFLFFLRQVRRLGQSRSYSELQQSVR